MRLTLRTMLAYLDEILEPDDAQQLAKKIEESEFAGGLVHRIRGSMRRLRLGAPKLNGKGLGLDANTVADYLDNTLSNERVPDFERVCLESDVHLAEIAACHQILTLVLGEPAEVSPALKDRIYHIGTPLPKIQTASDETSDLQSEEATGVSIEDGPIVIQETNSGRKRRSKPQVPDYLRENSRRRFWPAAITAALAILVIGGVVYLALPPGSSILTAENSDDASSHEPNPGGPTDEISEPTNSENPENSIDTEEDVQPESVTPDLTNQNIPSKVIDPANDQTMIPRNDTEGDIPPLPQETEIGNPPSPVNNTATENETPAFPETITNIGEIATEPLSPDRNIEEETPENPPPTDEATLAQLVSENEILIRYDGQDQSWYRLPVQANLNSGERFIALPTSRPTIDFASGLQATLAGGSALTLTALDESGTPELQLDYGRLVLTYQGKENNSCSLKFGNRNGLVTLADSESALAVEVRRLHLPGNDPETNSAPIVTKLYPISGQIQWQEGSDELVTLEPGNVLALTDEKPAESLNQTGLPKWAKTNDLSRSDLIASGELEPNVDKERPVNLSLEELAEKHRRIEVRALAARCLTYLDQFDQTLKVFNNEKRRGFWALHYESLHSAFAHGTTTAAEIRAAVERFRGDDADEFIQLLYGFSPDDLENGDDQILVDYLDHEELVFRLLAIENLKRITGRNLAYVPYQSQKNRLYSTRRWQTELKDGKIRYKVLPEVALGLQTDEPAVR